MVNEFVLKIACVVQAASTPSAAATPAHAAQQTHPSHMSASHSAGIHNIDAAKSPATFQAPLAEMLPIEPTVATSHAFPSPLHAGSGPELHSSPILLDIQTSVSPMLMSGPQPAACDLTPLSGFRQSEVTSPVALAPSSTAQPEAPTPTLLPRGSAGSTGKTAVSGSPPVVPPVLFAAESPRNILSSLQQMNLQSRPFDLAGNVQDEMSPSEQTPEPFDHSDSSQQDTLEPVLEQTPEPYDGSTHEQVVVYGATKYRCHVNEDTYS